MREIVVTSEPLPTGGLTIPDSMILAVVDCLEAAAWKRMEKEDHD